MATGECIVYSVYVIVCTLSTYRNKKKKLKKKCSNEKKKKLFETIDNKLSFDEQYIYKTAKKLIALSRINCYMKQSLKRLSPFTISKTSTKKFNVIFEKSLQTILNDYESLFGSFHGAPSFVERL